MLSILLIRCTLTCLLYSYSQIVERINASEGPSKNAAGYNDMRGLPHFRQSIVTYLQRTFMRELTISADEIAVGAGAGALIEATCFTLCDEGETVLIPSPLYPAFITDLERKINCRPLPVPEPDNSLIPRVSTLQQYLDTEKASGRNVRALLLTNPLNPTGITLHTDTAKHLVEWALANDIHLLSDEIYANSIFDETDEANFRPSLAIAKEFDEQKARKLVHTIAGMSKDMCASGYRCGFMHTQNSKLMQALSGLCYFCCVSHDFQTRAAQVLQDVEFIDRFVDTNKKRLKEAYKAASEALTECGIEHVSAGAAMFIWADVRKHLRERTIESERELWNKMFKEAKILATPGESALAAEPGFLRFCFAATPINVWPEFSNRMKKILQSE